MMDIILNTIPKSNNNSVLVVSCNVEFESHRNELFILYNIKNKKDYVSLKDMEISFREIKSRQRSQM